MISWTWFFFFQAEDGIRDDLVTGVQTCALPICAPVRARAEMRRCGRWRHGLPVRRGQVGGSRPRHAKKERWSRSHQIGRASCRGRVEISVVAGSLKKKKEKAIRG